MKPSTNPIVTGLLVLDAPPVWIAAAILSHAQAITDRNSISVLPTATYQFSAGGVSFDGYVHNALLGVS